MEITSNSNVIFNSETISNLFIMKILYPLFNVNINNFGDCGSFSIIFCLNLLKLLLEYDFNSILLTNTLDQLLLLCIEISNKYKVELLWNKIDIIINFISNIINTKSSILLTENEIRNISIEIIQSFINCLGYEDILGNIKIITEIGCIDTKIESFNNTIFIDTIIPSLFKKSYNNCNVILYDVSITSPELNINIENSNTLSIEEIEEKILNQIGNDLLKSNINILMSQRLIHPYLKSFCYDNNILYIERLSIRHIEIVHKICGGNIISKWDKEIEKVYNYIL